LRGQCGDATDRGLRGGAAANRQWYSLTTSETQGPSPLLPPQTRNNGALGDPGTRKLCPFTRKPGARLGARKRLLVDGARDDELIRNFQAVPLPANQCSTVARQQSCFASCSTTLRVWPRARLSDCRGIEVTRGLSSQPRPVGMSRVNETASHCR